MSGARFAVHETFNPDSLDPHWTQVASGHGRVGLEGRLRLAIEQAPPGQPALAQLDDYVCRPRAGYRWAPPLIMETRVRFSHAGGEFLGTAGFGFWNNPAPLWGTGFEAVPRWAWFYYASPESVLALTPGPPHGFKAAMACGGQVNALAAALCMALLKAPGGGRPHKVSRVPAVEMALDRNIMAGWHTYCIAWLPDRISFRVDGWPVLESGHALAGPLAFVAWVDNNVIALNPAGKPDTGHLGIDRPQWLEMEYLTITKPA